MTAFWDLDSCRALGMGGVGRIPWLAMKEYADHRGYDEEEFEDFVYLLRELDSAFLERSSKQAQKMREDAQANQHRRPREKRHHSRI